MKIYIDNEIIDYVRCGKPITISNQEALEVITKALNEHMTNEGIECEVVVVPDIGTLNSKLAGNLLDSFLDDCSESLCENIC